MFVISKECFNPNMYCGCQVNGVANLEFIVSLEQSRLLGKVFTKAYELETRYFLEYLRRFRVGGSQEFHCCDGRGRKRAIIRTGEIIKFFSNGFAIELMSF